MYVVARSLLMVTRCRHSLRGEPLGESDSVFEKR
jgi:hypothetical protein